jgi:hypothetical protein
VNEMKSWMLFTLMMACILGIVAMNVVLLLTSQPEGSTQDADRAVQVPFAAETTNNKGLVSKDIDNGQVKEREGGK